ncbi:MAG: metal-dependent transcriptional regulator [Clostridia bacterium]|nr:metal-dependent transcriptional regulator [Clostridia bacterium]
MNLQESGEMYLEAIYVLAQSSERVRSTDVGTYLGYSKPSVSRAVGILKNGGFVSVEEDGSLSLLPKGYEIAKKMYERHTALSEFLQKLGVPKDIAAADACKIEHDISDVSFGAIIEHYKKMEK